MQAQLSHNHVSAADAAARLRYLDGIQQRARRAALSPALALVVLGAIGIAHGLMVTLWPHGDVQWLVWIAALVAIRPVLRRLRRRLEERRGLESSARLRAACTTGAVAFTALAVATGANPLVSALAAATALVAYLSGMQAISLTVIAIGLTVDLAIRQGLPAATGQMLAGAALVATGLLALRSGRSDESSH